VRDLAFDAAERVGTRVAGSCPIVGDSDRTHQVEIFIALCRGCSAVPDSSDHADFDVHGG
jgi:hypothetical protein